MRPLLPVVAAAAVLVLAGCSEPQPGSPLPTGGGAGTGAEPGAEPSGTASEEPSGTVSAGPSAASPTGAPEPTAGATSTASAEPSAAPTVAPTLPPEATTNDAAGAEAFVEYWFSSVNFAYDNLDVEPMSAVSSAECDVCSKIDEEVDQYRAQGSRVEGGDFTLSEAIAPTPDKTGVVVVAVVYTQEPFRIVNEAGAIQKVEGESASLGAVLRREGNRWSMYGLGA